MKATNQGKKHTWLIMLVALSAAALVLLCGMLMAGLVAFNLFRNAGTSEVVATAPMNEVTMFIDSQTAECGDAEPRACLLVKFDKEAGWEPFYDNIVGFEYEPGFEYELLVSEIETVSLPADTPTTEYWLLETVSKTAVP